uniref:Uncharacterized protein n=1 Tax=Kalanchoe fedtschenkoi TaxID=63787 RepID=A0A7N0VGR3_KALFE
MVNSPATIIAEKKPWWLSNRKIADRHIRDAKAILSTRESSDVASALVLIESALSLSPKCDTALEIKARCLLHLRRYREIADMLQDYIPSIKVGSDDSSVSSENSSQPLAKERVKLLASCSNDSSQDDRAEFKCFSVFDLKKRVMAGICKNSDQEGRWRYLVLGQACFHLGLMEDAVVLIQTGKRLSSAAFRHESNSWSDDSFFTKVAADPNSLAPPPPTESESTTQLLAQIKQLLRRKTAAIATMEAGAYAEAVRHFSKILDSRRGGPIAFLAECYMHRAIAYKSAGRIAESISDCNRALALEPSCIHALITRSSLLETIWCLPDCLHDLEHLKLLYNSILRDRKLPGPVWKRHNLRYTEIPGKLLTLAMKMEELKHKVANGESGNVDYYMLMGLRRGCSRSELEKANLVLSLRHKPERVTAFIDKCEFTESRDLESIRERVRISALLLHRLLQKGYAQILSTVAEEEKLDRKRKAAQAALEATALQIQKQTKTHESSSASATAAAAAVKLEFNVSDDDDEVFTEKEICPSPENKSSASISSSSVYKASFCRDLAVVGSLLSQVGFNRPISVKYEALTC